MATIITRAGKASALAASEYDDSLKRETTSVSGAHTVVAADNRSTVEYTGSGGHTITLPDCSTIKSSEDTGDFQVTIKHGGTGALTVDFAASDTVDGTDEALTLAASEVITLKAGTGDDWMIVSRCIPDGTEGYIMRMGAIIPTWTSPVIGFRGTRAGANQVHNNGSGNWEAVICDTETYDHLAVHNTSTGLITNPTDYDFFKVDALIAFESDADGNRQLALAETNGATGSTIFERGVRLKSLSGEPTLVSINTGWIPISAYASFYLMAYQDGAATLDISSGYTRFYVEFK